MQDMTFSSNLPHLHSEGIKIASWALEIKKDFKLVLLFCKQVHPCADLLTSVILVAIYAPGVNYNTAITYKIVTI